VSSYRADPYADVTFEASVGGSVRRLAARDVSDSPDDRHRATIVRTAGGYALAIGTRRTAGRKVVTWSIGKSGRVHLAWSPDSRRLVAIGSSSGSADDGGMVRLNAPGRVWLVSADGDRHRPIGRGWRVSWSPDGTRLAIERSRAADIRTSDGRLVRTLPTASRVVWSSDSRRIAYVVRRSTFAVADERGRTLRTLTGPSGNTETTLAWSPTGRVLLATFSGDSGTGRELIEADGAKRSPFYGTPLGWRGSHPIAATRTIERLVSPEGDRDPLVPVLSPDGRWVVLTGNSIEVGVYDARSGLRLAGSPFVRTYDLLRWSPDSGAFLIRSADVLQSVSVPRMTKRRLASLPADSDLVAARWISDDTAAFQVSRRTLARLHLLDLQTLRSTEVPTSGADAQPFYEDPWWSPNGSVLAARRTPFRGTGEPSVVVIGSGIPERTIGRAVGRRGRPTWSPDGAAIALVTDEDNGVVSARNVADGSERMLAKIAGAADVAWSPDGRRIAVVTGRSVLVMPIDQPAEPTIVVPPLGTSAPRPPLSSPTWSPDGTRIAFTGPSGLVVASSDGSRGPIVLVRPAAHPSGPTWSPDGEWIVFAADDPACPDRLRLMIVPSVGGTASHLHRTPDCQGSRGPAWRPR
jgi:Tol biopolymer transport system component